MDDSGNKGVVKKIILTTLMLGAAVALIAIAPGIGPVLRMFSPDDYKKRRKFSRALYDLEKRKLVSISYKGKNVVVTITEKGKERVLKYQFDDIQIKKPKTWDKLWRMVIFDIPTKNNKQRDMFRLKLNGIGFKMIQKSTFIFPYPVKNEIDFLGEYLGIRKYITYILIKEIEGDKNYKKLFDIQ